MPSLSLPRLLLPLLLVALSGAPPARANDAALPPHPAARMPFVKIGAAGDGGPAAQARGRAELARQGRIAERAARLRAMLGPEGVSRRALAGLAARGLGPARRFGDTAADKAIVPDTLKVLIVRIGFNANREPSLTTVGPDGDFDLAADPAVRIDPPPHNRAFYESHLYGLSQYYTCQSGGRLVIRGAVLPSGENDCYRLSDPADYGPGADAGWSMERLERFVRDMIAVADTGVARDGLRLGDFGDGHPLRYVIFVHAGSDWQSDINGDSPNDFPTFFVDLGEPAPLAGGGSLSECSVIPETTSQDGGIGSIAAALYHEFGHALGLPDIYDTSTGLPSAGYWTLMDAGTNLAANIGFPSPTPGNPDSIEVETVTGLLPPSLGAWEKWFLGWLECGTLDGDHAAPRRLPAVQVSRRLPGYEDYAYYRLHGFDFQGTDHQAYLGGASPREFFIFENRWVPLTGDELPETEGVGLLRDAQTGVILYLAGDDPDGDGPLPPRNTGMYDFFMPDGGLLVWHVNQARIEAGLADNTVNSEGDGLRLVEADGIRDIGTVDPYVLGFWGSPLDPFHAGKPDSPATSDTLRVDGAPSSRAFDRSWTGVSAGGISANEALMTLRAGVAPLDATLPWELPAIGTAEAAAVGGTAGPRALDPASVTPCVLGGGRALVCADARRAAWGDTTFAGWGATLFAVRPGGAAVGGVGSGLPAGALHRFAAALAGPPLVVPGGGEDGDLVIAGARDGTVAAFASAAGGVTARWTATVGAGLAFAPVRVALTAGVSLACCVPDDATLRCLGLDGAPTATVAAPAAAGAFALAPLPLEAAVAGFPLAVFGAAGWFPLLATGLTGAPHAYGFAEGILPARAAALTDSSGLLLLVAGTDGTLRAWRIAAGAVAPATWGGRLEAGPAGELAVADLDGDGRDDLVVATPTRLHAFNVLGAALHGFPAVLRELFPLADSTRLAGPLAVFDADGDGRNEVGLPTLTGHLLLLDARGRLAPRTPFLWGGEPECGLAVGAGAVPGERLLWLADGGGSVAPPLARRWRGGRLVGLRLPGAEEPGSTEWLGPAGGPSRTGPTGTRRDLGAASVALLDRDRVILFPNPAHGSRVTVRFYSAGSRPARLALHDLAGEVVAQVEAPAVAGVVNEFQWGLPPLASGVYLVRVEADAAGGRRRWLTRLAVER